MSLAPAFTPPDREMIPSKDDLRVAITEHARTAASMPTFVNFHELNEQWGNVHAKINSMLSDLGL